MLEWNEAGWPSASEPEESFIYVYDALCGWCYGFGPVIRQLEEAFGKEIPLFVLSGGMVPEAMAAQDQPENMKTYLREASGRIESMCGVKFGEPFLMGVLTAQKRTHHSDAPGKALCAVKMMEPSKALAFASEMQRAFFVEGNALFKPETYLPILEKLGLDPARFMELWNDPAVIGYYASELEFIKRLGIAGFPALLYRRRGQYWMVARGFRYYSDLEPMVEEVRKDALEKLN